MDEPAGLSFSSSQALSTTGRRPVTLFVLATLLACNSFQVHGLNHYKVLEVSQDSNSSEIKKAYRRLSLSYHPDKNKSPDAIERFNAIATAYEVLSDEERRAEYDDGYEMMFDDVTGDFAGFLRKLLKSANAAWEELGELEMSFSSTLCEGLEISVFEPVMAVYHNFVSVEDDDEDDATVVILEQQYPGLALGEALSQTWIKEKFRCDGRLGDKRSSKIKDRQPANASQWHLVIMTATAAALWFFRGRTLMFTALGYMLILANLPQEHIPVWRTRRGLAIEDWAESIQLPVLLSLGYLVCLQVGLVFLGSLPLHFIHRALVGSLLTAVVSGAVSGAMLSLWWPIFLTQIPAVKMGHVVLAGLVLICGCWFPLDIVNKPCLRIRHILISAWMWPVVTCAKIAEGYIMLPLGMSPFTDHPYWMRWLRWLSAVIFHRFPLWLLDQWSNLVSYFMISCLLFMLIGISVESIRDLQILDGLLANFGGAVLLWATRAQAIRMGMMPI